MFAKCSPPMRDRSRDPQPNKRAAERMVGLAQAHAGAPEFNKTSCQSDPVSFRFSG